MTLHRRGFLVAGGSAALIAATNPLPDRVVQVTGGKVSGIATATPGVSAWLGIPFAAPPVGRLRWRTPKSVVPWQGVRKADRFSLSPCQMPQGPKSLFATRPVETGEDCLTVNVWAPTRPSVRPRPVMVWIYGGAYVAGTTDNEWYDGAHLAQQDVVFVSLNYRVGILGFFAHPELSAESPDGVSGNYALHDQVAALRWIRDNIAAFGGDPDNVTIMGQSAGAFSVAFHLVMPQSRGLFHRAVVESGAPMGPLNSLSMISDFRQMEADGVTFARKVGAANLAELRAMDPMTLVKAYAGTWNFNPALDGKLIPEHPFAAMQSGRHADVPLIAGFNANEGNVFPTFGGGTPEGLNAVIGAYYGSETEAARRHFASTTPTEAVTHGREVFGDLIFDWNTTALAKAAAQHGRSPVYFYHYAFLESLDPAVAFTEGDAASLGAYHGAEIGYALRNPNAVPGRLDGPRQRFMTEMLSRYWLNLARAGNPNGESLPQWSPYVPGSATVLHIDAERTAMGPAVFGDRLALLSKAYDDASGPA
ncbi:MAG TPA: carboxylesterase family protein [Sphingomonas sp.]